MMSGMKLLSFEEWKRSVHEENGIKPDKEKEIRTEAVLFMEALIFILDLNPKRHCKSIIIFHKFSAQVSFKEFDRFLIGAAAVFLTAKLEDDPKSLERCVKIYLYCISEKRNIVNFSENKERINMLNNLKRPDRLEEFFKNIDPAVLKDCKTKFLDAEEYILKMIGFDFAIETPFTYIESMYRKFYPEETYSQVKSYTEVFANDGLKSTLCLFYDPLIIALACVNSAMNFLDVFLPDFQGKKWFQVLNPAVTQEEIEEATLQLNKFYDS